MACLSCHAICLWFQLEFLTQNEKKYCSCPSALAAEKDGTPVFKFPKWRAKGKPIQEVVEAYKSVGAELNVLPFCTQFIPMDVIDCPKHGSIIYHPSILPRHRGASAINWWVLCITKYVFVMVECWSAPITLVNAAVLLTCKCSEGASLEQLTIWYMNCTSYLGFIIISNASSAVTLGRSVVWSLHSYILLSCTNRQTGVSIRRTLPLWLIPTNTR